jgi:hypothetical protein
MAPGDGPAVPLTEEELARQNLQNIVASPSYRRAHEDPDFLAIEELRGVRLELELTKVELSLRKNGIRSTIVVSEARVLERPQAEAARRGAGLSGSLRSEGERRRAAGRALVKKAHAHDEAREPGRIVTSTCQTGGFCDFVVMTGGGPGVMEAANRGAYDAGGKTVGLNIELPHEQVPNSYITPELCFLFHYFAVRKMHFLLRAKALVAFPGGFGTLDELFETLTLIQTHKMPRIPVVLFDRAYWETLVNWQFLVDEGTIRLRSRAHRVPESA